jgi:hypothetical protein
MSLMNSFNQAAPSIEQAYLGSLPHLRPRP